MDQRSYLERSNFYAIDRCSLIPLSFACACCLFFIKPLGKEEPLREEGWLPKWNTACFSNREKGAQTDHMTQEGEEPPEDIKRAFHRFMENCEN